MFGWSICYGTLANASIATRACIALEPQVEALKLNLLNKESMRQSANAVSCLASVTFLLLITGIVRGQPQGPFPTQMQPAVAIDGQPFGVVIAEVPVPAGMSEETLRVLVEDAENRLFYPAVTVRTVEVAQAPAQLGGRLQIGRGALIDRLRNVIQGGPEKRQVPVAIKIAALYRGEGPLQLQLVGDLQQRFTITPVAATQPQAHGRLVEQWWTEYVASAKRTVEAGDHPSLVQKYLTNMLAQRLNLPPVDLDPPDPKKEKLTQPLDTLALLAAIEPLRDEVLEDVLRSPGPPVDANLNPPMEPNWITPALPPVPAELTVEPIATRVPAECFYLRFGSFNNYIWFQELSSRFGGDIAQAVLMRGFNYEASMRIERMLGAKLSAVAKLFGDKIIDDMALIGTDLYFKEGASLGVLFSSKNAQLLVSSMQSDRKAAAGKTPGASIEKVTIAGRDVSFLSTPDNRLRSFMVADGDYVFVTTSSTLMRRFLEVGGGEGSLASLPSFRWSRAWMPEANNYSVYAFFSPEFFHRLVSPQYQIELRRRLESIAHIEIAEVASAAARAEGIADDDLQAMQSAGLVPPWFDRRADGAKTLRSNDQWIDSMRGARGAFLPIADVEIQQVTATEAEGYSKIAEFYQTQWQQMDPLLVGLRRFQLEGNPNVERVAIEGYIAPFRKEKYGWIANMLGPATPLELTQPADDVAAIQLHMSGSNPLGRPTQDYHLFAGIKDTVPPAPEDTKGLIRTLRALRAVPAYLGAWPMPGLLDQLPLGLGGGPPDYAGFSRMLGGLWRWQGNGFSLLSFDRGIIEQAIPQLATLTAPDQAQARLRVGNLQGSQLAGWINGQWYERGWKTSHGNARLLDSIHQQLKVPGPESLAVAQQLLDVRLQCPLGGDFQFQGPNGQVLSGQEPSNAIEGWWTSSAWGGAVVQPDGNLGPPANYSAPWLNWFRGARVHLTQLPERLAIVGTFDLELQPLARQNPEESKQDLLPPMNFDIFQLPFKLFGDDGAKTPKSPERQSF